MCRLKPLAIHYGFWFCVVIAIAIVLRRLIDLIRPSHGGPPQMDGALFFFRSRYRFVVGGITDGVKLTRGACNVGTI